MALVFYRVTRTVDFSPTYRVIFNRGQFLEKYLANVFFSLFNTRTTHTQPTVCEQQHCYDIPKKPHTLAGFKPGSSDPEAFAMSTAPRRHGQYVLCKLGLPFTQKSPGFT
jgi:hypothetical protein